jgi:hypothetical protein
MVTSTSVQEKLYLVQRSIYEKISSLLNSRQATLKVAVFFSLVTFVAYFPDYDLAIQNKGFYQGIDQQIHSPFDPDTYIKHGVTQMGSHFEKRKFRLTVPLLARLTHLNTWHIFMLQHILLVFFFALLYKLLERILTDPVAAFLISGSFCFVFVSKSFLFYLPFFDCFAFLFIVCLLHSPPPFLIFLLTILTAFTDERGFVASLFVWCFYQWQGWYTGTTGISIFISRSSAGLIAGWITALGIRYFLHIIFGLSVPVGLANGLGFGVLASNYTLIPLGVLLSLEGLWIPVLGAFFILLLEKKQKALLAVGTVTGMVLVVGFVVYDITRSTAYVFPVVFIALRVLKDTLPQATIRTIAFATLAGCILIPTYTLWGGDNEVYWMSSLFPKVFKYFL